MSQQAMNDLKINQGAVNYWFTVEILEDEDRREDFFSY